jgi:hypothetical protein
MERVARATRSLVANLKEGVILAVRRARVGDYALERRKPGCHSTTCTCLIFDIEAVHSRRNDSGFQPIGLQMNESPPLSYRYLPSEDTLKKLRVRV